jgi:hypothetical protein
MYSLDYLLEVLDEGAFVTPEEMADIAKNVRALRQDAERYRWLTKYTSHLFMCTPEGLDEQMNRAMGRAG